LINSGEKNYRDFKNRKNNSY